MYVGPLFEDVMVPTAAVGVAVPLRQFLIGCIVDVINLEQVADGQQQRPAIAGVPGIMPDGREFSPAFVQRDIGVPQPLQRPLRHPGRDQVAGGIVGEQVEEVDLLLQACPLVHQMLVGVDQSDAFDFGSNALEKFGGFHDVPPG